MQSQKPRKRSAVGNLKLQLFVTEAEKSQSKPVEKSRNQNTLKAVPMGLLSDSMRQVSCFNQKEQVWYGLMH
jgi:hypothetical protein